jgi:hypothetical protein
MFMKHTISVKTGIICEVSHSELYSMFSSPASSFYLQVVALVHLLLLISHKKAEAAPLHTMEAHGGRGDVAPTHS